MTALDPSIILQAGKIQGLDPNAIFEQRAQVGLRNLALSRAQSEDARLARQEAAAARQQQTLTSVGQQAATGDVSGARTTALGAGQFDLVKQLDSMGDEQRKRAFDVSQHAAPILAQLSQLPTDQQAAAVQQAAPMLQEAGWGPAQLQELQQNVGNPNWFKSKIAAAQTIAEYQAQADKDRTFGLSQDKFAYDQKHDAATLGVTMRGQDLSHADSAAGRAVTMRGQNMADARAAGQDVAPLLSKQAVELAAQQVANGGDLPAMGMGKTGAALKATIMNRAAEIAAANGNDGASMNLVKSARKANSTALTDLTKRNGVMSAAKNTAVSNGNLLVSAANTGAGTTGSPLLNRWQQAYRSGVKGSPDVAQFGLAINTFANEYAKVVSGATGAAGVTEGARQEMLKHLGEASTSQQVRAIVEQAKKEMASSTNALSSQIKTTQEALRTGGQRAAPAAPAKGNNVIRYDAKGNRIK